MAPEQDTFGPVVGRARRQIEDMLSAVRDRGDAFEPLRGLLRQSLADLSSPLRIAFVGQIKTSKSTLINALLAKEEAMHTGDRETTWNVSRLRFGPCEAPVRLVFRRSLGLPDKLVSREEWGELANRASGSKLRDQVYFFELSDDNPSLRHYDIIDTPGLGALSREASAAGEVKEGVDAQNTREYLRSERPDAIVYLFRRGISLSDADLNEAFQGPVLGVATPLNAIGILARFDDTPLDEDPPGKAWSVAGRWEKHPKIAASLHRIFPVCARLALGARTMGDTDWEHLRVLGRIGQTAFRSICLDATFLETPSLGLPVTARRVLRDRFTLWGLYTAVAFLEAHPAGSQAELAKALLDASGFPAFEQSLRTQFGARASVLKLHRAFAELVDYCETNSRHQDAALRECLFWISRSLYEFRRMFRVAEQLDAVARQLADGLVTFSEAERQELHRVAGGRGHALSARLDLPPDATLAAQQIAVGQGMERWQGRINDEGAFDPDYAQAARAMRDVYSQINTDLGMARSLLDGA